MCGIAGIYRPGGAPIERRMLEAMTTAIAHRGPDGKGVYLDKDLGLGHRRLSIIDLSDNAAQPMTTTEGDVVIAYNGEIYNFLELRQELAAKGHVFKSRSDTEVILRGYKEWGLDVIPRLNGMFAFALWDVKTRRLILTRDRFGIKPLYVWMRPHEVSFASEIKALLTHPEYRPSVDETALNEYFTFQNLFRSQTLFKGIQMLSPARVKIFTPDGKWETFSYWDYDFANRDQSMTEQDAYDETLRLFKRAVVRQMVADVPVGAYLSGGMDSGSITAIASTIIPRLSTFTCGFDMSAATGREANFDERRDAEVMSSVFKTEQYEQVINAGDLSWSMPRVIWHLEDLRVGMSYPNFYISRLASRFVKVCLSGTGGDELYGGYPWRYYAVSGSVNREKYFDQYYGFWQRLVKDEKKQELFTDRILGGIVGSRSMFDVFSRVFTYNETLRYETPEDHVANCLYFEAKTFLPGLFVVGDKLAMAHSLEERFPFMDNELVAFAQKIPIRYKLANFESKQRVDENELRKLRKYQSEFDDGKNVLRKAMGELVPRQILSRKKQGFSAPDESWYRGENLAYVKEILLGAKVSSSEYIRREFVERVIREHTEQKANHRLLIWSLLSFEWWCKIFLEGYRPEH